MLGMMLYIDNFAGNMQGVKEKIPYLKECNINCLHLMPFLFPCHDRSHYISILEALHNSQSYFHEFPAVRRSEELLSDLRIQMPMLHIPPSQDQTTDSTIPSGSVVRSIVTRKQERAIMVQHLWKQEFRCLWKWENSRHTRCI